MDNDNRQFFIKWLTDKVADAEATIEEFRKELTDHPVAAFEWADSAAKAAAMLRVSKYMLDTLDKPGTTWNTIREYGFKQVMRKAMYPQRSTSPSSNLVSQCECAAWAEVLEMLDAGRW